MFMAKNEIINAGKLIKIILKNTRFIWIRFFAFVVLIFLGNTVSSIYEIFQPTEQILDGQIRDVHLWNYSSILAVTIMYPLSVIILRHKEFNQKYIVFPQTNTSRFLATQAFYYILLIIFLVVSMLLYLMQNAIFALIATANTNIILVYPLNLSYMLAGFFVLLMYMALISASITMVSVLIEKFRINALISLSFIGILFATNINGVISSFKFLLGLLIFEKNLGLFITKGFLLWIVLIGISLVINKHTVYYESSRPINKRVFAITLMIGIGAMALGPFLLSKVHYENFMEDSYSMQSPEYTITLDTAEVPLGSSLNIKTSSLIIDSSLNDSPYGNNSIPDVMYLNNFNRKSLSSFTGQEIIITYELPVRVVDYVDLTPFTQPEFSARLEGNTIYLDYQYAKNIKAVFIPVWSFMGQFEQYKGINKDFLGASGGYSPGQINIMVERTIQTD